MPDWLWGVPNDDPGTHDFGPALSEADVAAWESRHGVSLPLPLRTAYLQQNGGNLRSQTCFLMKLEGVEPVGASYFSEVCAEPPAGYDVDLTFYFGWGEADASVLLGYRSAEDPRPDFYGWWSDGGDVAWTSSPEELL